MVDDLWTKFCVGFMQLSSVQGMLGKCSLTPSLTCVFPAFSCIFSCTVCIQGPTFLPFTLQEHVGLRAKFMLNHE